MNAGEAGKTSPVQSRDCGSEGHSPLPREHSSAHSEAALPEVGEGNCPGLQDGSAVPVGGSTMSPRSVGGIPRRVV